MSVTYKSVKVPNELWPRIVEGMRARQDRDPERKDIPFAVYAMLAIMAQVAKDLGEKEGETHEQ